VKTVFFDIDTQVDFLYPAGALYVPGAERIIPAVAQLNRHAAARGITVVSDMDAHAEDDAEFRSWPPHCVAGTAGQAKPPDTLLAGRVVAPNVAGELPAIEGAQQILVEKQTLDIFGTVTIRPLLDALRADAYVVYGVVTEYCVRLAALGLLATGKPVTVVTDAVETLDTAASLATVSEICAR
jgi:nicotinamidase/pyrazinamidase